MKKTILFLLFVAAAALSAPARNPQKGTYGYLYCHMSGAGALRVVHAMPISAARTMPKAISW